MRENSPDLLNSSESIIVFSEQEFSSINEQFASACLKHGDGWAFNWSAAGGEYEYAIHRVDVHLAQAIGASCNCWELVQKDKSGKVDVAIISVTHQFLEDVFGRTLGYKAVNDVYCAAIDLSAENRARDDLYKQLSNEARDVLEHQSN